MKLADKPCIPNSYSDKMSKGLTFRERLIGQAMVALLSNASLVNDLHNAPTQEWVAEHSISQADTIIKQLDEEKK